MLTNDRLNGAAVTTSDVTLTLLSAFPGSSVGLDVNTGIVSIAPNTAPGVYNATYQICERLQPSNCDSATVTVTVAGRIPSASLTIQNNASGNQSSFIYLSTIPDTPSFSLNNGEQRAFNSLAAGSYTLEQVSTPEWQLTQIRCNGQEYAPGAITLTLAPGEQVLCVFNNVLNEEYVSQRTLQSVASFLNQRAHLMLATEPNKRRLLDLLRDTNPAAKPRGHFKPNFSEFNFGFSADTSLSQLNQGKLQQPLDFWVETSSAHFQQKENRAYNSGEFGIIYVGADYRINNRLLGGILGEFDAINQRNNSANAQNSYYKARGTGWMVGPYLSGQILSNLYFYSRASWGTSQNRINVFTDSNDSFSTQRQMYVAELSGWYQLKKLNIIPTLGARYFDEQQNQFTNFANFYIPSQTVTLGQINAGPEFNYPLSINDRLSSILNMSLQGIYNFKNTGLMFPATINAHVFGRLNLGSEFIYRNRLTINPIFLWDGVGSSGYNALGGKLQISYRSD